MNQRIKLEQRVRFAIMNDMEIPYIPRLQYALFGEDTKNMVKKYHQNTDISVSKKVKKVVRKINNKVNNTVGKYNRDVQKRLEYANALKIDYLINIRG